MIPAGMFRMIGLQWRTSWGMLLMVPAALAILVTLVASGIRGLYDSAAERDLYAATMGASPAAAAFNGRGHDLDTLGGITAYEVGFMGQLAIPVLGILLAIHLTRRIEDSGSLELITACAVDRIAVPLAAMKSAFLSWALFGMLGFIGLAVQKYPLAGAARYVVVLALFGVTFSMIGIAVAELSRTSRQAATLSLKLVFIGFIARAVIDGLGWDAAWATPFGWVAAARPWGNAAAWPYVSFLVLSAAMTAVAVVVRAGRDLGSGVFAERLGKPGASPKLLSPIGVATRLTRGSAVGWMISGVLWAAAIGLMSQEFVDAVAANPSLAAAFGTAPEHLATVLAVLMSAVISTAAGLTVILRHGTEELSARLGLLHAGRFRRWHWWLGWCVMSALTAAVTLLASVTALGLVQRAVMGRHEALADAVGAGVDLLAPVLAMVIVGAFVVAAAPRLRGLVWLFPAWALVVGLLGEALQIPQWLQGTSPLHLVGAVPVEEANGAAIIVLASVTAITLALSWLLHERRDLARG